MNPLDIINNQTNDDGLKFIQNIQYANLQQLHHASVISPYLMNSMEYETATKLFSPRPVIYNKSKSQLKHINHPVAALLNHYANQECINEASRFKTSIDIGGSPLRTPKNTHMCVLIDDMRTDARYTECAFNQLNLENNPKYNFTNYLSNKHAYCIQGAQNCHYAAEYAYAVNVYDITFEQIAHIFVNHKLIVLDIWMFLPLSLIKEEYVTDKDIYTVRHMPDGKSYFHLNDNSNMYVHNTKNWLTYLTVTTIKCRNFGITVEHKKQHGTFTQIRFTRTTLTNGPIHRCIQVASKVDDVLIPDMIYYINQSRSAKDPFLQSYLVPKKLLSRIVAWATGCLDTQYNYNNFASYMTSIMSDVKFTSGNKTIMIHEGFDPEFLEGERIKQSLFIILSILRFKRTKDIQKAFKEIKNSYTDGFWSGIWEGFKQQMLTWWVDFEFKVFDKKDHFHKDKLHHIFDIQIKYPKDQYCKGVVTFNISTNQHWRIKFIKDEYDLSDAHTTYETFEEVIKPTPITHEELIDITDHYKVILDDRLPTCLDIEYNPPGDGKCGLHALTHIAHKEIIAPIGRRYKHQNKVYKIGKDWYEDLDLAFMAYLHGLNLKIHADGKLVGIIGKAPYACLNVQNGHWTVNKCYCDEHIQYVGEYKNIPIQPNATYVNCANENLTDGAGQALEFSKVFNGYAKNIKKPIDVTNLSEYTKDKIKVYLFQAVAFKCSKEKDFRAVHVRLHQIFQHLETHCLQTDSVAYLPLIGTGLYRNDLCCFKTVLNQYKFKKIICFRDDKQQDDFMKTSSCRHGGFKVILRDEESYNIIPKIVDDFEDFTRLPHQYPYQHLDQKFDDIIAALSQHTDTQFSYVYDLSCAPGFFYNRYMEKHQNTGLFLNVKQYINAYYTGSYSSTLGKFKHTIVPDFCYNNFATFLSNQSGRPEDTLYIYDNYVTTEQVHEIMSFMDDKDVLITKTNAQNDKLQEIYNTIINAGMHLATFISDYSPPRSFEMYIIVFADKRMQHNIDIKNVTQSSIIEDIMAHKNNIVAQDTSCNCDQSKALELINCNVRFDFSKDTIPLYQKQIVDSFKLFNKEFDENLLDMSDIEPINIQCVNGIAGASKTSTFVRTTCHNCTTIISPYKSVTDQCKMDNINSYTFMIYLHDIITKKRKTTPYIVVDEVFALSAMYLSTLKKYAPSSIIVGCGDSKQIDYRNYSGNQECYQIEQYKPYITTSNRCPQFIIDVVKKYIPDAKTTSKVRGNIEIVHDIDTILDNAQGQLILCFTQKTKEELKLKGPDCKINTVNAVQGMTAPTVRLYLGDLHGIQKDKVRYIYTALTRTTTKFVLYGSDNLIEETYQILGTEMEKILHAHNIIPVATVEFEKEEIKDKKHTHVTSLGKHESTDNGVDAILKKIYIPANPDHMRRNIIGYKSDVLPQMYSGKLKVSDTFLRNEDTTIPGKRISDNNYLQYHANINKKQKLETAVSRYMKQGKHIKKSFIDRYIKGFNKFMKPGWEKKMRWEIAHLNKFKYVTNYLKKLQTKYANCKEMRNLFTEEQIQEENTAWLDTILILEDDESIDNNTYTNFYKDIAANQSKLDEFDDLKKNFRKHTLDVIKYLIESNTNKIKDLQKPWQDTYHRLVQFHLKTQPKEIREPEFDAQYKAGQGVSAWSKLLNVLFSSFTRCYTDLVGKYVLDNVQLSYGKPDTNLQEFFQQYSKQLNSPNYKKMMADFSEFDSSQEEKGILSSVIIFKNLGFDDKMMDFYMSMRSSWSLYTQGTSNNLRYLLILSNEFMQHSGQPFTLDGNTMFNMSAIGMCYEILDLVFAAFKGDDSAICARNIKNTKIGEDTMVSLCSYKIKVFNVPIMEYIANIITPDGKFFPDVLRRVTRAMCKIHKDQVDWEETKTAITDALDVIHEEHDVTIGCQVASKFYAQYNIQITPEEIYYLLNYLHTIKNYKDLSSIQTKKYTILNY